MTILGYRIETRLPEYPFHGKQVVNTINPHSYVVAKQDASFREALMGSDLLLPDGTGIVWAVRKLHGITIPKVAGADVHAHLLTVAQRHGLRVLYMGSTPETLAKITERIQREHPNILVGSYSPPFKKKFDDADNEQMLCEVKAFRPDILFVGMTAPKQEKWVHQNREQLSASVICSIGAVFDFYAGTVKRPSAFWIHLGLEWLPRLLHEPRRLWRRMCVSAPIFVADVLKEERRRKVSIGH
jgi:N-acetylglucosaminyldiphosphoundecaprenol N-acetyl-beta-D-mannosaminyltransferase